jgi:hypothetical protein
MANIFHISDSSDLEEHADYKAMIEHLALYKRSGDNKAWDDYRKKVKPDLLAKIAKIFEECLKHGFIGPYVKENKLFWRCIVKQYSPLEFPLEHIECTCGTFIGQTYYVSKGKADELVSNRRAKYI